MVLDIFALIVIAVLVGVVIGLVVYLGQLPGKIAAERNHPQADAIRVLGWIGVITVGTSWLVALVWAYYRPTGKGGDDPQLAARTATLEKQVQKLSTGGSES